MTRLTINRSLTCDYLQSSNGGAEVATFFQAGPQPDFLWPVVSGKTVCGERHSGAPSHELPAPVPWGVQLLHCFAEVYTDASEEVAGASLESSRASCITTILTSIKVWSWLRGT
jgi:hypothetical protein